MHSKCEKAHFLYFFTCCWVGLAWLACVESVPHGTSSALFCSCFVINQSFSVLHPKCLLETDVLFIFLWAVHGTGLNAGTKADTLMWFFVLFMLL